MSRWAKFRSLSASDWRTLLAAAWLLARTEVIVRLKSVKALGSERFSRKESDPSGKNIPDPLPEAQRVAWLVNVAARHGLVRSRCLVRSLVVERLLIQRGIGCDLHIGVHEDLSKFTAHAWVEVDGVPLADPGSDSPGLVPLT